jgi:hypothetical protein
MDQPKKARVSQSTDASLSFSSPYEWFMQSPRVSREEELEHQSPQQLELQRLIQQSMQSFVTPEQKRAMMVNELTWGEQAPSSAPIAIPDAIRHQFDVAQETVIHGFQEDQRTHHQQQEQLVALKQQQHLLHLEKQHENNRRIQMMYRQRAARTQASEISHTPRMEQAAFQQWPNW